MLLLLVYFCCLEANVFYFGPGEQQAIRMSEKDKFNLLVAYSPTRLERWNSFLLFHDHDFGVL